MTLISEDVTHFGCGKPGDCTIAQKYLPDNEDSPVPEANSLEDGDSPLSPSWTHPGMGQNNLTTDSVCHPIFLPSQTVITVTSYSGLKDAATTQDLDNSFNSSDVRRDYKNTV